jgi:hypothetical protein
MAAAGPVPVCMHAVAAKVGAHMPAWRLLGDSYPQQQQQQQQRTLRSSRTASALHPEQIAAAVRVAECSRVQEGLVLLWPSPTDWINCAVLCCAVC